MANGLWIVRRFAWPLLLALMIFAVFMQATMARESGPQEITIPKKLLKRLKSFEPSAAIALNDGSFLVASDDTTEADEAMLFLMDREGNVSKEPVMIDGVDKMTDIESLSSDGGWVYAMSSQSRNKKGKEKAERNLFVRGKLEGGTLTGTETVELRSQLLRALPGVNALRSVRNQLNQKLEIEASYVSGGRMFAALKDPQPRPGVGLLLDLGSADDLFAGHRLEASAVGVAAELNFGGEEKISDVVLNGEKLLISATLEKGGGSVWSFEHGSLRKLTDFPDHTPEGLATVRGQETLVVFDQGEDPAQFSLERF